MNTYISILRGINVSGQKPIRMEALRKSYENMGFHQVRSYIQSGNIVFSAEHPEPATLSKKIEQQIEKDFGYQVPVIVMSAEQLEHIANQNPFPEQPGKDPSFFHVTFLSDAPGDYDHKEIAAKKLMEEEVVITPSAVYLYCPKGYGRSKLTNNLFENKLKVRATTRNWRTVNRLLEMARATT